MWSAPETLPAGTLLAGKLRVLRPLGAGGMGAVYEIEHEITKHHRALKVLHRHVIEHPGAVERFLREASAAGRIGDPHIVETFDAGTLEGGEPYVVLELLSGETLADRIAREGHLELEATLDIVAQACEGVEAAHAAGIVHRDLKPENLFLVPRAAAPPFVKLLDFGISKFEPERTGAAKLTGEGTALGTPLYMSPEQVRGSGDVDGRADVYALGVILYECATGQAPFDAEALPQLMVQIHEGIVVPLAARRPDLPAPFCDLVARAMATERDVRLPTARALREAIRRVEADLLALSATAPGGGATTPYDAAPAILGPDLRETAAPASSERPPRPDMATPPPPASRAVSPPPDAALRSVGPRSAGVRPLVPAAPVAVPAPPPSPRRPILAIAAAAAALVVVVAVVVAARFAAPAAIAPAMPPASSETRALPAPRALPPPPAAEPTASVPAPRVEPAPPPATASADAPRPPPASATHTGHPLAKPPPSRPSGANRADQAGLAKSPFQ